MDTRTIQRQILIVEDDQDMREAYKVFFSDQRDKYEVNIVGDALEATRMMNEVRFDLVIVDIIMEPVAGDSLSIFIRENKETADIPILVISVLSPETLEGLKTLKNIHFLHKPITEDLLLGKIDEILAESRI